MSETQRQAKHGLPKPVLSQCKNLDKSVFKVENLYFSMDMN